VRTRLARILPTAPEAALLSGGRLRVVFAGIAFCVRSV
jgi:hypothetical protein